MYGFRSTSLIQLSHTSHCCHNWRGVIDQSVEKDACFSTVWHCSLKCHQIFQETDSLFPCLSKSCQQFLHFSVARCIVLILTNTSLVSETLLTKPLMHIHVHVAIILVNIHVFFYGILQHLESSFHVISITKA